MIYYFLDSFLVFAILQLIERLFGKLKFEINFLNLFLFFWYFNFFKNIFLYFTKKKVKHFETKFASTDFKLNLLNLKKIKKNFLRKIDFLKN